LTTRQSAAKNESISVALTPTQEETLKATIVGRPISQETTPTGAIKLVMELQHSKPVPFPKGVPPLPSDPFKVIVFVGAKQYRKVEPSMTTDPDDKLILEGQAALDPSLGLVLHCTNCTSSKTLQAARTGKEGAAEGDQTGG
jgi:hypothetical protein